MPDNRRMMVVALCLRELARLVEAGGLTAFRVAWEEGDPILEVLVKKREGVDLDRVGRDGRSSVNEVN